MEIMNSQINSTVKGKITVTAPKGAKYISEY